MRTNGQNSVFGALKNIFRSLESPNFRLFFTGQSISLIGTWMQSIGTSWLIYKMTNSTLLLGILGFATQIPTFLFTPLAGVLADRYNKHRIIISTQALSMLQAIALTVLLFSGRLTVWQIFALGILLGCINAVDIPARHSFIVEMVEKKELLGNAIALNSMMFNSARLIGPAIAGLLISLAGEGVCFLINALSFIAVLGCLLKMRVKPRQLKHHAHVLSGLKEGVVYAFRSEPIRMILILLGTTSLIGASYVVLMPAFAKDILKGDSRTLGFLISSIGLGALGGTIFLASQKHPLKVDKILPLSSGIFGASLMLFSLSRSFYLSLFLLLWVGFGFMVQTAASNTILQTIVEDDKRGRVMSFYTMAFMGTAPFGSLIAGTLASKIGVTATFAVGGIIAVLVTVLFARRLKTLKDVIIPLYEKMAAQNAVPTAEENLPAEIIEEKV